jgi:predicted chitinase
MPGHRTLESLMASGYDLSTKDGTIAAIRQECGEHGLSRKEQVAYVLATIQHETNNTFRPIKEAYYIGSESKAEKFRRNNKIIQLYYPFYGRGYIQLTHDYNYRMYGNWLGLDFLSRPERVCEPPIALFIAIHGLRWGAFTTQRLGEHINDQGCDFLGARRCVNGTDKAEHIAGIARTYLDTLQSGTV